MCLILFAYRLHPDYPLLFAANRDEFYGRPTAPAAFWDDAPGVLAGRDLQAGGTWCGVTRTGRFAAVTNYREPDGHDPGALSRGHLVADYLAGDAAPAGYLERLAARADRYNGFNLLVGDPDGLFYLSNRGGRVRAVEPGLHGLSNHLLDTPWPKVVRGRRALHALVDHRSLDLEPFFEVLADETQALDEALPDTGVGPEWERRLSPLFIRTDRYGTRTSTVLWIRRDGHTTFAERTYDASEPQTRSFIFELEPAHPDGVVNW